MNVHVRRIALMAVFSALLIILIQTGCDELITQQIEQQVAGTPQAEFSVDKHTGCAPLTVQFEDESYGPRHKYIWSFGTGDTLWETIPADSTIAYTAPQYTYTEPGIYKVTLTIWDTVLNNADTEVKERFITVGVTSAEFTADPDTATPGEEVTFYPKEYSYEKTFSWDFGDGDTSIEMNAHHAYAGVGVYDVQLATYDGCGYDTVIEQVTIVPRPVVAITADSTSGCVSGGDELEIPFHDASYSDGYNTVSWAWQFSGGTPLYSVDPDPVVIYDEPGYKTVVLQVRNEAGGIAADTFVNFIAAHDDPIADIYIDNNSTCYSPYRQFIVRFADSSSGIITGWLWEFGDGTTDTVQNPVHAYTEPGRYTVKLTVENLCGQAQQTLIDEIVVSDLLLNENVAFKTEVLNAEGTQYRFTDTTNVGIVRTRTWQIDDATWGSGVTFEHTFTEDGDYKVSLIVGNDCGSALGDTTIHILIP